ncbi:hypothetical protein D9M68_567800 [compost metagenome]
MGETRAGTFHQPGTNGVEEATAALRPALDLTAHAAACRRAADSEIGKHHRHHDQLREDQYADTNAGGDRQVADHRDIDHHQDGEAKDIG